MNKASCFVYFLLACVLFASPFVGAAEKDITTNQEGKSDSLIVFEGKVYCSLIRPVLMPFPGVLTEISISPGQSVENGESIVQYDLDEARALQLGREIFFEERADLLRFMEEEKLKLTELERNQRELRQLTEENLSPKYMLQRLQKELELTKKYIRFLDSRSSAVEDFENRTLEYMRKTIGDSSLEPGKIPDVVTLKAPIAGIVLSLHPQLRRDSLLPEGAVVAQIGKMDTMVIRSLVYERDVVHLSVGNQVRFFPDSLPGRNFPASITAINWLPATPEPDLPSYYQVEMAIDNKSLELRAGFKGRIECQLRNQ